MDAPQFYTSGDLARLLNRDAVTIRFILSTRPIPFAGRAGQTRLYPEAAVEQVRLALNSIVPRRPRDPVPA
jgi:hypothetical protein